MRSQDTWTAFVACFVAVGLMAATAGAVPTTILAADGAGASDGPVPVDSCTTISTPGEYVLTSDIEYDGGDGLCLRITSSDVSLNGNGHELSAPADSVVRNSAVLVANRTASLSNVSVSNLTVRNWGEDKVAFYGVTGGEIRNVTVTSEKRFFGGITAFNSHDLRIVDNRISTASAPGMILRLTNSVVADNVVTSDGAGVGIEFRGSANNVVRDNTISNVTWGLIFAGTAPPRNRGNLVEGTRIRDAETGIFLADGAYNAFADTHIRDVQTGVYSDAAGTTFEDTVVTNASQWAFVAIDGTEQATNFTTDSAVLSFEAANVALGAIESPPADPENVTNVSQYVAAAPLGDNPSARDLRLTIHYGDTPGVNESTLRLCRYDPPRWTRAEGVTTVDLEANSITVSVTDFGIFAPFGERTDAA